ncbi:hypothetical protein ACGF1Z_03855 [Streptomyces sp. NPDC048018]|uniref:hypothetical protein n=1 Tax=Streptomyces sp. NPDC048018 TaxID=3365499 RepID=UPI003711DD82
MNGTTARSGLGSVVVGVGGSPSAHTAVMWAAAEAALRGSALFLADPVVVGGRRAPGYLGPTIGRTTLSLLQHAHCPVELIPRQGPGHGSTS